MKRRSVEAWGERLGWVGGKDYKRIRGNFCGYIFIISIVVMVSWVYPSVKTYQTIHFKYVQFILYYCDTAD